MWSGYSCRASSSLIPAEISPFCPAESQDVELARVHHPLFRRHPLYRHNDRYREADAAACNGIRGQIFPRSSPQGPALPGGRARQECRHQARDVDQRDEPGGQAGSGQIGGNDSIFPGTIFHNFPLNHPAEPTPPVSIASGFRTLYPPRNAEDRQAELFKLRLRSLIGTRRHDGIRDLRSRRRRC